MADQRQASDGQGNRNEPRRSYEEGEIKEPTNRDKQNYQDPPHDQGHAFRPEQDPVRKQTPPDAVEEDDKSTAKKTNVK